jgi:hypothetical protein
MRREATLIEKWPGSVPQGQASVRYQCEITSCALQVTANGS